MFFFPFFAECVKVSSLKVSMPGFYDLNLDEGSHFSLHLQNKTAYFFGNIQDTLSFKKDEKTHEVPSTKGLTQVSDGLFDVHVIQTKKINFWVIESSLCNHSAYLEAEDTLNINITSTQKNTCFFSQPQFSDSLVTIKYAHGLNVNFRNALKMSQSAKLCVNQTACSYVAHNQFFFIIDEQVDSPISLQYSVKNSDPSVVQCFISSDDSLAYEKPVCSQSIKPEKMKYIIIESILIVSVIVLVMLKIFWKQLCQSNEALLFENLKSNPYAPPLEKQNESDNNTSSFSAV